MCNGTRTKKNWPIILQKQFVVSITKRYALGVYTRKILLASYHMQQHLALWKGVLELYPVDILDQYPSHMYLS